MTDSRWYQASLVEVEDFLDLVGEGPVIVNAGDSIVAAMIAMLNASSIVVGIDQRLQEAVATIRLLEA